MFRVLEYEAVPGVKYVSAANPARAESVVASIYGEGRNDYAIAGPMTLHSPSPDIFADM